MPNSSVVSVLGYRAWPLGRVLLCWLLLLPLSAWQWQPRSSTLEGLGLGTPPLLALEPNRLGALSPDGRRSPAPPLGLSALYALVWLSATAAPSWAAHLTYTPTSNRQRLIALNQLRLEGG